MMLKKQNVTKRRFTVQEMNTGDRRSKLSMIQSHGPKIICLMRQPADHMGGKKKLQTRNNFRKRIRIIYLNFIMCLFRDDIFSLNQKVQNFFLIYYQIEQVKLIE